MILDRAINALMETQTLSQEELGRFLKNLFLTGEDVGAGQRTAERLSPVAAAHRILSNSFGLIPFSTYVKDGDTRRTVHDPALDRLPHVWANERMSPFLCQKLIMSNAFWHGFGTYWNRRDGASRLVARIPLPTECCTIRKDRESWHHWYDYNVNGWQRTSAPYELSFLYLEIYDGIQGCGLLELARETTAMNAMAQRYERKFHQNGARFSEVLEVDIDAQSATRQKLKDEFRGYASDDAFAVAVLGHGVKLTPLGLSQSDAQYIESRAFTVEEIARFTGIPKHMLQTGKESCDLNSQQWQNYVTDILLPYVVQWEQEDGYKAIPPDKRDKGGWYMRGDVAVLLRGDDLTRSQFYERMIRTMVYSPDECQALGEKPPTPGGLGQHFLATKNLASLEAVLKGEKQMDISLRGELWDNDSADVLRFWGWRDITAPMDIVGALERAGGEDVTLSVNSPGGDMTVRLEIRSMLRRYAGKTTALLQSFGTSTATLAATGCRVIQSEPGALLCYHDPAGGAEGDYRAMWRSAEALRDIQDCVLEVCTARGDDKTREKLVSLMDKDIWITPTQAREYDLVDEIVGAVQEPEEEPAAFVATAGRHIRLTVAIREQYQAHVATEQAKAARKDEAARTLAWLRALAGF